MNRQFNPSPLVCPHCGHVIGEQAYFQSFEVKVASWLQARVAPPATKGYDVYDSLLVPDKTFQVKYAQMHRFHSPKKQFPVETWTWKVKSLDSVHPDFFVLFGIDEDGTENVFLLSRDDYLAYASRSKDGGYFLHVSSKRVSNRRYAYIPKIWRYLIENPLETLGSSVLTYTPKDQDSMFLEAHKQNIEEIRALYTSGMSQTAIGERYGISQKSVSRLLSGKR
jgi:hypothetical protein